WSGREPKRLPTLDTDDSNLSPLERDLKTISQSLWLNENTEEAWNTMTDEEKKFVRERWSKIVLDIEPRRIDDGEAPWQSHVILPKYYKQGKDDPSYITLWGGAIEENGKRYLVIPNRDKKEFRIEFELKGDTLRLKGKFYWISPGQGITMAPSVFDGEYQARPRE
ncbi:MAG: hypothetical protein ACRCZF_06030, partial [Gemmataceae bacterium]